MRFPFHGVLEISKNWQLVNPKSIKWGWVYGDGVYECIVPRDSMNFQFHGVFQKFATGPKKINLRGWVHSVYGCIVPRDSMRFPFRGVLEMSTG